ncbi:cell division protein FtsB [Tahibacter aquaticus]|uniref:Cell division protein FtsB n=1 Tax=Tahibacter aquaticus TaxID=520092 RepID=A0A4R6YP24_9GAMM|nr:cell division protein FtsB [Tahibacter aquaticus]TDR39425.1 cell division protein FtsB [Tahibacter aquaticus]
MLRYAALILLILLIGLQLKLWTGAGGVRDVDSLRQTVAQTKRENEELKARNEALAAEVRDLKEGRAAIEERARSELGLIKPGETFYQIVEPSAAAPAPTPQQK